MEGKIDGEAWITAYTENFVSKATSFGLTATPSSPATSSAPAATTAATSSARALHRMQILLAQIQCTSREFANRRSSNTSLSSLVVCFGDLGGLLKNDAVLLSLTPSLFIPRDCLRFDALPERIGHILLFVERFLGSKILHA
jgi:hypothetical protein